jgi:hypothetical protein
MWSCPYWCRSCDSWSSALLEKLAEQSRGDRLGYGGDFGRDAQGVGGNYPDGVERPEPSGQTRRAGIQLLTSPYSYCDTDWGHNHQRRRVVRLQTFCIAGILLHMF